MRVSVSPAKDLTHLRDEVAQLRERISRREDEALALIDQQQEAATALAALEAERRTIAVDEERLEAEIAAEWKVIDAELGRLETREARDRSARRSRTGRPL